MSVRCNCGFCLIISLAVAVLVGLNLHQYWEVGWTKLAVVSIIAIPVMAFICGMMSRRQACKGAEQEQAKKDLEK